MTRVRVEAGDVAGVRVLTLDDPGRRNALSRELLAGLADAVHRVAADPEARVLVVTGAGLAFCAGADLPQTFDRLDRPVAEMRARLWEVYESFLQIRRLPILTVAAVNGPAIGAGLNLAFSCDLRIAAPQASFGVTFTKLGLHPGGGCTYFLVRTVGAQKAMALLLDGATVSAPEALALGMILSIEDNPLDAAIQLANRYAALPRQLLCDIKQAVDLAMEANLGAVVQFESWAQASSAHGPALRAAIERLTGAG